MENQDWSHDRSQQLGRGGFGAVYRGTGPSGERVAAKVVPKAPGATRDLLAADLPVSSHVVPVLHVEEMVDEFVIYMPLAEKSLRDRMTDGSALLPDEALNILEQVARGLESIGTSIVHRDLKPENVLLLNGEWAICDFGIARYADASTAADTQKFAMTPPYAAPEQWRHEHATAATDVYAFGVIACELLTGTMPFNGPSTDDYRDQHLYTPPPPMATTKKLASLITECLFKAADARPSTKNLIARLQAAGKEANSPGASALAEANHIVVQANAAKQSALEAQRTEAERRDGLFDAAQYLFVQIVEGLVDTIRDAAPTASIRQDRRGTTEIVLGPARLRITPLSPYGNVPGTWDVIAFSSIHLDSGQGATRSHSLYYADFETERDYQWFELGFSGSFGADFNNEPRALPPQDGLQALSPIMGMRQLAFGIVILEVGLLESFIDSWSTRLGLAAQGRFPRVHQLPEGGTVRPRNR